MENIFPVRIIDEHGVDNADNLLKTKVLQIGLNEKDLAVFHSGSHIILDFGKELSGSLRFLSYTTEGSGNIRVRLGESVSEVCHDIGEKRHERPFHERLEFFRSQFQRSALYEQRLPLCENRRFGRYDFTG